MRLVACLLVVAATLGGEPPPRIFSLTLEEKPAQLARIFENPPSVFRTNEYRLLQFHESKDHQQQGCERAFDWEFYADANGTLQSVSWSPERPIATESLFPLSARRYLTNTSRGITTGLFIRTLPGGRLLIAPINSPGEKSIQHMTLIRAGSIARFLPWVADRLGSKD